MPTEVIAAISISALVLAISALAWLMFTPRRSRGLTPAIGADTQCPTTGKWAFSLVVIMLGFLFVLSGMLLWLPTRVTGDGHLAFLEYCKWFMAGLLGAFGAWIGAGAAYFFGRENLRESSRSTEAALRIQQETMLGAVKAERIRDIGLSLLNPQFKFDPTDDSRNVATKLRDYPDYWWVPVIDKDGKVVDIVHARAFWDPRIVPITTAVEAKDAADKAAAGSKEAKEAADRAAANLESKRAADAAAQAGTDAGRKEETAQALAAAAEEAANARETADNAAAEADAAAKVADAKDVAAVIKVIETDSAFAELRKLHGQTFYVAVSLDDSIKDVSGNMAKTGAVVGVVVDSGRPTYCFTKQNLLTATRQNLNR